jgi:hypothetical protein
MPAPTVEMTPEGPQVHFDPQDHAPWTYVVVVRAEGDSNTIRVPVAKPPLLLPEKAIPRGGKGQVRVEIDGVGGRGRSPWSEVVELARAPAAPGRPTVTVCRDPEGDPRDAEVVLTWSAPLGAGDVEYTVIIDTEKGVGCEVQAGRQLSWRSVLGDLCELPGGYQDSLHQRFFANTVIICYSDLA